MDAGTPERTSFFNLLSFSAVPTSIFDTTDSHLSSRSRYSFMVDLFRIRFLKRAMSHGSLTLSTSNSHTLEEAYLLSFPK